MGIPNKVALYMHYVHDVLYFVILLSHNVHSNNSMGSKYKKEYFFCLMSDPPNEQLQINKLIAPTQNLLIQPPKVRICLPLS